MFDYEYYKINSSTASSATDNYYIHKNVFVCQLEFEVRKWFSLFCQLVGNTKGRYHCRSFKEFGFLYLWTGDNSGLITNWNTHYHSDSLI